MASVTQDVDAFVREALGKGASREAIENALAAAGWPAAQTRSALNGYADVDFPVPVPKPRPYLSARDAFLYLVLFTTLYVTAFNLGSLQFDLVDRAFPDPAASGHGRLVTDSMRWSIASLVIAFPVFAYVARHLGRELARDPAKRLSAVRRWLTYLTLFVAAAFLVGDMITLVYNALGGELAVRFVIKVAVVALIAGTIFGYYLHDMRREEQES